MTTEIKFPKTTEEGMKIILENANKFRPVTESDREELGGIMDEDIVNTRICDLIGSEFMVVCVVDKVFDKSTYEFSSFDETMILEVSIEGGTLFKLKQPDNKYEKVPGKIYEVRNILDRTTEKFYAE